MMGCDIYCYREERDEFGVWRHVGGENFHGDPAEFEVDRNYWVFGALGFNYTLDDIEAIAEARGLPDDVSDEVKGECAVCGRYGRPGMFGHHHSWVTLAELNAYNFDGASTFQGAINRLRESTKHPDDVRLVFWFD